jgi:hypothetical protein
MRKLSRKCRTQLDFGAQNARHDFQSSVTPQRSFTLINFAGGERDPGGLKRIVMGALDA